MEAKDFISDENGDLLIRDGDFVVDFSDAQHINDILISAPGTWKQHPLVGVDIVSELNAPGDGTNINAIRKRIQSQMEFDGLVVEEIKLNSLADFSIVANRR